MGNVSSIGSMFAYHAPWVASAPRVQDHDPSLQVIVANLDGSIPAMDANGCGPYSIISRLIALCKIFF